MDSTTGRKKGAAAKLFLVAGLIVILFSVLLSGCARREGWGMVLWSVKGTAAKAGTVVPIYLKSNISKSYVIGLPDDNKTKIEVPFPSLEFFSSKSAAETRAREFAPYAALYLSAGRDGLPIREKPSVNARRVYRLRLGESVKVLSVADGEAVFTGGKALPGEWYFVQAIDGTRGYVFSNTMVLYEEKEGTAAPVIASSPAPSASLLDIIYARPWRPAYYQIMVDDSTIDPDLFILRYGLFADAKNSQVRIELPGYSAVFSFTSVSQSGDWLVFEGSKLRIRFEIESTIVADWSGTDPVLADEGWAQGGQA
ncbi:MAG: SH3 domain-containing protein, partial [Rectinema sp.]